MIIAPRPRDLDGLQVRRVLPFIERRSVGPFVFFDHMGPAQFAPGHGMSVRPHPHIHLATVTFLFDGCIEHRDSLGSDQRIEPGAVNWMVAGRGIVHSERSPKNDAAQGAQVHGIQCWLALPLDQQEVEPSFTHHPASTLPRFRSGEATGTLVLGEAMGARSPAATHSPLFYFELNVPAGESFEFAPPTPGSECGVYLVSGAVEIDGQKLAPQCMWVCETGLGFRMRATADARLMVLGGETVGPRVMEWNFVSSDKANIDDAKRLWSQGPSAQNPRFQPVPGDDQEFIPLP